MLARTCPSNPDGVFEPQPEAKPTVAAATTKQTTDVARRLFLELKIIFKIDLESVLWNAPCDVKIYRQTTSRFTILRIAQKEMAAVKKSVQPIPHAGDVIGIPKTNERALATGLASGRIKAVF